MDFYFDFTSPYGFLASRTVDDLAQRIGRTATWHPFLIGAVYKEYGGAPLNNPLKRDYVFKDVFRTARLAGAGTMVIPENFPSSPVLPSRVFYWIDNQDPSKAREFAKQAYMAFWIDGRDPADPATSLEVAQGLGFDTEAITAGAQEQTTKDRLRDETGEAMKRGVFGSPFILIDDESFWGFDRFDHIAELYG